MSRLLNCLHIFKQLNISVATYIFTNISAQYIKYKCIHIQISDIAAVICNSAKNLMRIHRISNNIESKKVTINSDT